MLINNISYYVILHVFGAVLTTIDINLPEYNYLADHLHPEECRQLVAALHFSSYDKPAALDDAERKVPENIPCLRLLLHWNSARGPGEGAGKTHEIVLERLRQIGRQDLAQWLGKTVFKQLGTDLERDLHNGFKDLATVSTESDDGITPPLLPEHSEVAYEWGPVDTTCWVFIMLLGLGTFVALGIAISMQCKRKNTKKDDTEKQFILKYQAIDQEFSDSGSEEKFNIINKLKRNI